MKQEQNYERSMGVCKRPLSDRPGRPFQRPALFASPRRGRGVAASSENRLPIFCKRNIVSYDDPCNVFYRLQINKHCGRNYEVVKKKRHSILSLQQLIKIYRTGMTQFHINPVYTFFHTSTGEYLCNTF